MTDADTNFIDRAESPLKSVAKRFEGRVLPSLKDFPSADSLKSNVRLYGALAEKHGAQPGWLVSSLKEALEAIEHVPGDTTTPPAPGAVWIGSGDA